MALAMAIMKIVLALITVFWNIFDHHIWSLYGQVFKAVVNICWKNNFLFHFQSSLQGPNFLHISVGFHLKDFCQFFGLQSKPITRFFLWAWHNFWQHNCFSLFITFCWLILFTCPYLTGRTFGWFFGLHLRFWEALCHTFLPFWA